MSDAGSCETGEKLDHTLRAYARLERRSAEKGREIESLRQQHRRVVEALAEAGGEIAALADALRAAGVAPATVQAIIDNATPPGGGR